MSAEPGSDQDGVGMTRFTAYAIAVLGTFLIMAALAWWMYRTTAPAPLGADRVKERYKNLRELRDADAKLMNEYDWQDKNKEIVRLPIARALEITALEWQNPAAARSNLIARVEKATAPAPAKPNIYE